MTVSIRDVARAAGVSVTTISRVLNDGVVAEETRRRVREAIERLHYVPHGGARSLITRRTETIGVVLPDLHGEFFSELIRGIDQAARRRGFHLLVSSSHSDAGEAQAVLRALRGRVDGLIVMAPDDSTLPALVHHDRAAPVVLINTGAGDLELDVLGIDNYGGARALVRHFLDLGHRRIALVGGPPANLDARERERGWRDALAEIAGPPAAELVLAGDFREASGHEAGVRLAALRPRPTAVFAANDAMAVGCLSALRELGLRVPEEIALGGFDDIPIARYLNPALTSVRVPIAELGSRAMERLLTRLDDAAGARARRSLLPTQLVVRASSGAPLRRGPATPARRTAPSRPKH
jgi:LacI family transcriptional regulator